MEWEGTYVCICLQFVTVNCIHAPIATLYICTNQCSSAHAIESIVFDVALFGYLWAHYI